MDQIVESADIPREGRARLPVRIIHAGKMLPVAAWTPGSIEVMGLAEPPGSRLAFRLVFPFEGYDFLLNVEGEAKSVDAGRTRIGFVNVTQQQRDVLAFLSGAEAAGELVEAGELIAVTGRRHEPARASAAASQPKRSRRRLAALAAIVILGLAVLQFAVSGAYRALYVIPARSAVVSGDLAVVAAPVAGQLTLLAEGETVARDQPLFEVAERPDAKTTINSPCDCRILRASAADGTYVRPGQPVATLVQDDGRRYVAALVPPASVMRLYPGASVSLEYVDGQVIDTTIARIPPTLSANGFATTELVTVEIEPGRTLAADAIGQPVSVRFDTFGSSWLGRLFGGASALANPSAPETTAAE